MIPIVSPVLGGVVQCQAGSLALDRVFSFEDALVVECGDPVRFAVEFAVEIHRHASRRIVAFDIFRIGPDEAFEMQVAGHADGCRGHLAAFTLLVSDIQDDVGRVRLRKRVSVETHALRRGQLGGDAVVVQMDLIETGL